MNRFMLLAMSCLTTGLGTKVALADEITLGGTIDFGADFGLDSYKTKGRLVENSFINYGFNLDVADTTDAGIKFGGSLNIEGYRSLAFEPYVHTSVDGDVSHWAYKVTGREFSDIKGVAFNVSGGQQITADDIVEIKVNSSWAAIGGTHTEYDENVDVDWNNYLDQHKADKCIVAGLAGNPVSSFALARPGGNGNYVNTQALPNFGTANQVIVPTGARNYLPAGQFINNFTAVPTLLASLVSKPGFAGGGVLVYGHGDRSTGNLVTLVTPAGVLAETANAYAGPFAEVRLRSSTTKLVSGVVCIVQETNSETKFHLQPKNSVLAVANGKVFVEGGFGRLEVQTEDYAGLVEAIGYVGDQADLESSGAIASLHLNAGSLGSVYAAYDALGQVLIDHNLIVGAQINLAGLEFTYDTALSRTGTLLNKWDAGVSWELDDFNLRAVGDSSGAFGLGAEVETLGWDLEGEASWTGIEPHKKSRIDALIKASTTINALELSASLDHQLHTDLEASWLLEGRRATIEVYGAYQQSERGGKVGVKLNF